MVLALAESGAEWSDVGAEGVVEAGTTVKSPYHPFLSLVDAQFLGVRTFRHLWCLEVGIQFPPGLHYL